MLHCRLNHEEKGRRAPTDPTVENKRPPLPAEMEARKPVHDNDHQPYARSDALPIKIQVVVFGVLVLVRQEVEEDREHAACSPYVH